LKKKRREQDARLKDQAGAKKVNRKALVEFKDDSEIAEVPLDAVPEAPNTQYQLPALLPDSILNSVPKKQRLDIQPETIKNSKRNKKPLTASTKLSKDITVGKTTYRISEFSGDVRPGSLPPKQSSKASRNVRETWLLSLRGVEGGATRWAPRKFARK
jgi:hypothetical protein